MLHNHYKRCSACSPLLPAVVGAAVVGTAVVGLAVVGTAVVGAAVVGAAVVGAAVVGAAVVGAAVVGAAVVGRAIEGASIGTGVGALVLVSSITNVPSLAMKPASSALLLIAAAARVLPLSSLRTPTASFTSCPKLTLPLTGPCRPAVMCSSSSSVVRSSVVVHDEESDTVTSLCW
jgi:hypothetical protein